MSLKALVWALEEPNIYNPSEKLVLIILSNYANESGKSYPSVETICRMTLLSDNTVRRCLKSLQDAGHISDTGKRFGPTQQVKVWQLPDESWKAEDPRHEALHHGGLQLEDPRKTPGRPPEDPRHGGQPLEPCNLEPKRHKAVATAPARRFSDNWIAAFRVKFGENYIYKTKDAVQVARLLKSVTPEEALETAKKAWEKTDDKKYWACVRLSKEVASFAANYTKIRLEIKAGMFRPQGKYQA